MARLNLSRYDNRLRRLIQDIINKKGLVKTGDLIRSIDANFFIKNDNIELNIGAIYYYDYLDKGTKYIKPREITKDVTSSKEFNDIMTEVVTEYITSKF